MDVISELYIQHFIKSSGIFGDYQSIFANVEAVTHIISNAYTSLTP